MMSTQKSNERDVFGEAETYFAEGEIAKAEAAYAAAIAINPQHAAAYAGAGRCARRLGNRSDALAFFERAAQIAPALPGLQLEAATELRERGRLDEAEAACHDVLKLAPDNVQAHVALAHCARKRGDRIAALGYFQAATRLAPALPAPRLEVALELRELGRLDEAEAACHDVLQLAPGNVQAQMGLGHCARARGNRVAALAIFEAAAHAAPVEVGPRLELATEQREAGDFNTARQTILAILAQHPLNLPAMLNLGHIERAAGQHGAALAAFEAAHNANPLQAGPLVEMALAERQLGHQEKCDKYLARALELDPRNHSALSRRAEQSIMANEIEQAYEYYKSALAEQPWHLDFQLGLLGTLARMGKIDEAISEIQRVEALRGPLPAIRIRYISLLRQKGQYYAALQLAREATQAAPSSFALWAERFQTEIFVGEAEQVEACLKMMPATTLQQKAQLERFKAMWAESRWQITEATSHYETAAAMVPQDSIIQNSLVRTKLLLMELDAARIHLRRARDLIAPTVKLLGHSPNTSQTTYGQLLNEYALDQELALLLKQQQPSPPSARAATLLGIVRDNPNSTAPAVNLLVALRQSGMLRGPAPGRGEAIPRIITQFWDSTDVPADVAELMESWREQNPDYALQRFDDARALAWLTAHYPAAVAIAYRRSPEPAQKSDIFRLAWLAENGGLYADADDRCLKPVDSILPAQASLVLYQEVLGTIGNNFIATAPHHPVLVRALLLAVNAVNRGDHDGVWYSTGPALLTRAFTQILADSGEEQMAGTAVLDQRELFQAVAIGCAAAYKNTNRNWNNTAFDRGAIRRRMI